MGILILAGVNKTMCQEDSYDIFTFTSQPGWQRSEFADNIQFTLQKGNNWAVVGLYKSTSTKGSIVSDFQADWNDMIGKNYIVTSDVSREENSFNGWQMMTGSATGSRQNQSVNISLLTFSCPAGRSTILLTTNDFSNTLEGDIAAFMGSVSVIPAETVTPVAGHDQPAAMDNYQPTMVPVAGSNGTFPTPGEQTVTRAKTSDGWLVEATYDYIQYSSPGIKVVQYFYVAPEDPNSNTDDEDLFWRKFLANYYSADSYNKFPNEPYAFMNRVESASGYAISKADGRQYFLVWIVALGMKCSFLAITNDEPTYKKYFSHPNDLITLERYNYFAASADDLQGSWVNSGFSGAMLYNTYSGMAAGMAYASVSEEWTFSGNTTRYFSNGATGSGVAINTFTTEEYGAFQLSGNDLSVEVTKPAPKTHEFWCGFVAGYGGLLLKLANKKFTAQIDYFSRKR